MWDLTHPWGSILVLEIPRSKTETFIWRTHTFQPLLHRFPILHFYFQSRLSVPGGCDGALKHNCIWWSFNLHITPTSTARAQVAPGTLKAGIAYTSCSKQADCSQDPCQVSFPALNIVMPKLLQCSRTYTALSLVKFVLFFFFFFYTVLLYFPSYNTDNSLTHRRKPWQRKQRLLDNTLKYQH